MDRLLNLNSIILENPSNTLFQEGVNIGTISYIPTILPKGEINALPIIPQLTPTNSVTPGSAINNTPVLDLPKLNLELKINTVVYDTDGVTTLPGVNVFVQGTKAGGITDANGKVTFTAQGDDLVFIEYMGYATQSFKAALMPSKVVMKQTSIDLNQSPVVNDYKFPWMGVLVGIAVVAGGIKYYHKKKKHVKTSL